MYISTLWTTREIVCNFQIKIKIILIMMMDAKFK